MASVFNFLKIIFYFIFLLKKNLFYDIFVLYKNSKEDLVWQIIITEEIEEMLGTKKEH